MAVVKQYFYQSHFILYFLVILCLMPAQILGYQKEQVKVSSKTTLHSKKVIHNKRNVPNGNIVFDKNSYYALLYVGGIMAVVICLMFFPNIYRRPCQYLKVNK